MGKSKRRRTQHRKKKRAEEQGQDSLSSSEGSYSDSDTSEEELTRSKSQRKERKRPSIIPDDASLDVGNDDLYPAREIRFKDWDAHILANLEHQRDLGLSQPDKERWDKALDEMMSLRRVYNERRRTGRNDIEAPLASVEKSVQTVNDLEDVGTQVTFENGANLSSHPSSSGNSLSNEEINGNARSGSERRSHQGESGEGSSGVIQTKVEVNEDENYWSFATTVCLIILFCLEKESGVCNTQNQVVSMESDLEEVDLCSSPTPSSSRKVNEQDKAKSSSPEAPSRRFRKRKAPESRLSRKGQGHVKSKNPAIEEPIPNHLNGDHETPSTSNNSRLLETPRESEEPGGDHMLPNLPTCYVNRRFRIFKGRKRCLNEEELFGIAAESFTNPIIVIYAPSGMGKTTYLAQLGRQILRDLPEHKLFYLDMKKVVEAVKEERKQRYKDSSIWAALRRLTKDSKMGGTIQNLIQINGSMPRTELLFDGFDNIQTWDRNLVYEILRCISASFESTSIRMWIAIARRDFKQVEHLLENVEIESYTLDPLDHASQVELIASYLEMHTSESKQRLLKFAKKCVGDLSSSKNCDLDLGNPLQCLLIGAACLKLEQADPTKSSLLMSKNILNIKREKNFLLDAASKRSFHMVKLILDLNKFSINCEGWNGYTPLLVSVCEEGNVDCLSKLKLLVEKGAYLDQLTNCGDNLLFVAIRFASLECLNYILNLNKFDINCLDSNGNTPLFISASEGGTNDADCLEKLKLIIKHKPNWNHLNYDKSNLILYAAQMSSAETFEYIISLNKFDINSEDEDGDTPLLLSVFQYDGVDCLKKLEMVRGQGGKLDHVNKKGLNLLHRAAQHASVEVLKYVIDLNKFDINSKDKFGKTALHYARIKDNTEGVENVDMKVKVKLLIEMGCTE